MRLPLRIADERDLSGRCPVWSGTLWHHLSNANLSEPVNQNVGPDELGLLAGAALSRDLPPGMVDFFAGPGYS